MLIADTVAPVKSSVLSDLLQLSSQRCSVGGIRRQSVATRRIAVCQWSVVRLPTGRVQQPGEARWDIASVAARKAEDRAFGSGDCRSLRRTSWSTGRTKGLAAERRTVSAASGPPLRPWA